jgi:hypothetical protein
MLTLPLLTLHPLPLPTLRLLILLPLITKPRIALQTTAAFDYCQNIHIVHPTDQIEKAEVIELVLSGCLLDFINVDDMNMMHWLFAMACESPFLGNKALNLLMKYYSALKPGNRNAKSSPCVAQKQGYHIPYTLSLLDPLTTLEILHVYTAATQVHC